MYKNALKEDLIRVVEELDGIVESTDTIVKLKTKIENSSTFESDPNFIKTLIQNCIDESIAKRKRDDIPALCQRADVYLVSEKLQVDDQIDDWLQQGIIKESVSDYCSPIVLCKKKDGNLRLCIDYRKLILKLRKIGILYP
ncbi:transposon Tf2-9 polyprotein [Trichonephila clavipes]|nr:transposon Tf2-9 polyprotein [Trichonephila clavipes]